MKRTPTDDSEGVQTVRSATSPGTRKSPALLLAKLLDIAAGDSSGTKLPSGIIGNFLLQVSANGLGFLTVLILARHLGVHGYGLYSYAIAWVSFLGVPATIGLNRFLVRGVAAYSVRGEWAELRGLLRRATQWVLTISLLLAVSGGVVSLFFAQGSWRWGVLVAMALIPVTALTVVRQAAMQGFSQPVLSQLPEQLISPALLLLFIVVFVEATSDRLTPSAAMILAVTVSIVAFSVGAWLLRRATPIQVRQVAPIYDSRAWLKASLPMMLLAAMWLLDSYISTILLGIFRGAREVGIFTIALKGSSLVTLALTAALIPMAPRMARLHVLGDHDGLQRIAVRCCRLTLLASLPVAVGLIVFRNFYFSLFGNGFGSGGAPLSILVFSQLINGAAGPVATLLMMTGHERTAAVAVARGVALSVVLNVVLVPKFGVVGSAIADTASLLAWNIWMTYAAERELGIAVTVLGRRLPSWRSRKSIGD